MSEVRCTLQVVGTSEVRRDRSGTCRFCACISVTVLLLQEQLREASTKPRWSTDACSASALSVPVKGMTTHFRVRG